MSIKFLVLRGGGILGLGGDGKCRFYFYGRGDFSDSRNQSSAWFASKFRYQIWTHQFRLSGLGFPLEAMDDWQKVLKNLRVQMWFVNLQVSDWIVERGDGIQKYNFVRNVCLDNGHFCRNRAECCFESTVSEERTHWVLRQTRWVLPETRWVWICTQVIGWKELTEFAPRNSVSPKKLTELGVWNRTPRNRIRPVSDSEPALLQSCRHLGWKTVKRSAWAANWDGPRGKEEDEEIDAWPVCRDVARIWLRKQCYICKIFFIDDLPGGGSVTTTMRGATFNNWKRQKVHPSINSKNNPLCQTTALRNEPCSPHELDRIWALAKQTSRIERRVVRISGWCGGFGGFLAIAAKRHLLRNCKEGLAPKRLMIVPLPATKQHLPNSCGNDAMQIISPHGVPYLSAHRYTHTQSWPK